MCRDKSVDIATLGTHAPTYAAQLQVLSYHSQALTFTVLTRRCYDGQVIEFKRENWIGIRAVSFDSTQRNVRRQK